MKAKQENIVKERERKLAQKQLEKEQEKQRQLEAKQAEKNRQKQQVEFIAVFITHELQCFTVNDLM
jgi:protein FAM50